jgi:hypothetical protein
MPVDLDLAEAEDEPVPDDDDVSRSPFETRKFQDGPLFSRTELGPGTPGCPPGRFSTITKPKT